MRYVFKWYTGYNKEDINKVLRVNNQDINRNNGFKLEKFRFRRETGRNWFSNSGTDSIIILLALRQF